MTLDPKDLNIRVIDQRIGMGIGGRDLVVRVLHKPTGIWIEVPRLTSNTYYDRQIAMAMLEAALTHPEMQREPRERE